VIGHVLLLANQIVNRWGRPKVCCFLLPGLAGKKAAGWWCAAWRTPNVPYKLDLTRPIVGHRIIPKLRFAAFSCRALQARKLQGGVPGGWATLKSTHRR
jgi:hypothetical protein